MTTVLTRRVVPKLKDRVQEQLHAMAERLKTDDLDRGDQGAAIKALQKHLNRAGLYHGEINGQFNAATEQAVQALQKAKGLAETGVVDAQTFQAVRGIDLFVDDKFSTKAEVGQRGLDILRAEKQLHQLGFKTGKVDGVFDPATEAAVRAFQKKNDLQGTGEINARTGQVLAREAKEGSGDAFAGKVLDLARGKIGFHEGANNSNPFSKFFGRAPEPWCADFVSWAYTKAGKPLNIASCDALLAKLKANGTFNRSHPKPGDIVMFDWNRNDSDPSEHTGLVEKVFKKNGQWYVTTIEGNSSDQVKRNTWPVSDPRIVGFGTIP